MQPPWKLRDYFIPSHGEERRPDADQGLERGELGGGKGSAAEQAHDLRGDAHSVRHALGGHELEHQLRLETVKQNVGGPGAEGGHERQHAAIEDQGAGMENDAVRIDPKVPRHPRFEVGVQRGLG